MFKIFLWELREVTKEIAKVNLMQMKHRTPLPASWLTIITIIIGATGIISKSFRKYLRNVPGIHEIKELQKTAILGTAHTLRKVLM
jgi:hypothetical protein